MIRRLVRRLIIWLRRGNRTGANDGPHRPQQLPTHKKATPVTAPASAGPTLYSITGDVVVYETEFGAQPARTVIPLDNRISLAPPAAIVAGSFLPRVLRSSSPGSSGWYESAPPSHFYQQAESSLCRLYELPRTAMGPVATAGVLRALALGMVLLHRAGWSTDGRPDAWLWSDGRPAIWVDGLYRLRGVDAGDGLGTHRDEEMLRHFVAVTSGNAGGRRVRTVPHHSAAIRSKVLGSSEILLYLLGMSAPGIDVFSDVSEGSDVIADIEVGCLLSGHGTEMIDAFGSVGAEISPGLGKLARVLSTPRPTPVLVDV